MVRIFAKKSIFSMIKIPQEDLTFLRVLGKGGCGEVYLAESKTLGKVPVKKTLLGGDEQIMQEFLNEAELLSKMNSPYIIRFFGTSRNKEGECIVMEYATNGTLFHFLEFLRKRKSESTFSWDKRYQMAQDITRGLLLMHSQGVLHRDMKSLNILLDQNMTAKISDFGLSKIKTKSQTTSSSLYVQNNAFGSLLWKAPETFSIKNPYTDKADIYALGIVFWEIASCQVPYEGFDCEAIKDSVKSGERLDIPSKCPVEFKELIKLCWLQEPKQRPTASNVFDKISQLIGQISKFDSENLQEVPQQNMIGSNPKRLVSEKVFDSKIEIERKGLQSLHHEVYNNNIENVKYLLSQGVDVNLVNEFGCTPLHYACSLGFIDIVDLLLTHNACITLYDYKSLTPYDYAKNQGFENILQLLERKMKQNTTVPLLSGSNPDRWISFQDGINTNHIITGSDRFRLVTDNQSTEPNIESEIDRKILFSQEKQRFLLQDKKKREEENGKHEEHEKQKKINKNEGGDRKQNDDYEKIGKWKSNKAPDFEGNVFEAAAKGKLTSIIYLIANGTNVNEEYSNEIYDGWNMKNSTPIHFSSRYGHVNVVDYLVKSGSNIDAKNLNDLTALHIASLNGHVNVVEFLVKSGSDIEARTKDNFTALHIASQNGHVNVVEFLVKSGSNNYSNLMKSNKN